MDRGEETVKDRVNKRRRQDGRRRREEAERMRAGGKKEQKQALMHCYILSGSITHANPKGKTPPYTQNKMSHMLIRTSIALQLAGKSKDETRSNLSKL